MQDAALVAELRDKIGADQPDYSLWNADDSRGAFAGDCLLDLWDEESIPGSEVVGIYADLQACGLSTKQSEKLVDAVQHWPGGDLDSLWELMLGALDGVDHCTYDSWSVLSTLRDYKLLPANLNSPA